jgi:hypothetical protein
VDLDVAAQETFCRRRAGPVQIQNHQPLQWIGLMVRILLGILLNKP